MAWWRCLRRLVSEVLETPPAPPPAALVVTPDLTRPDPRAAAHTTAAREALYRGDLDAAAEAATAALQIAPADLTAGFYLGQARLRQQRYDEARAAFRHAAAQDDAFGLAAAWLQRVEALLATQPSPFPGPGATAAVELERAARAALRRRDWPRAHDLAAEAVRLDPANLLSHHHLGQALVALGHADAALAVFEDARPFDGGLGLIDFWIQQALAGQLLIPAQEEPDEELDEEPAEE